jgi:TonB-dependent receptor-like protein/carboxypeptidase-like protein
MVTWALLLAALIAQAPDTAVPLRGRIVSEPGAPIDGANVFLLETLDGALTNPAGVFAIRTAHRGVATLVVRRVGFKPRQIDVSIPRAEPLLITLEKQPIMLAPVAVQAGRYTAGDERGATLTTLEVVTTPGAAADVNRAIQTLPGVQSVDEGTALFVRGGDYTETKVLLDGAVLLNPTQLRTATGTFVGTVDPFLLDGIFFSSGGFGARYGNALSGIVALRTQGRPSRTSATASAGLAAFSGAAAVALPRTMGLRLAGNRFDLDPFLRVNGSAHQYDPAPVGHDMSGSVTWSYRPSGEVKVFGLDQTSRLGVGVDEASYGGTFHVDDESRIAVATWRDAFRGLAPWISVSTSDHDGRQQFGVFRLGRRFRSSQIATVVERPLGVRATLRAGGEWERVSTVFDGSIPARGDDVAPGARVTLWRSDGSGDRGGLFAEADWRLGGRVAATTGVRTDRSTLTRRRTTDPRLSVSLGLRPGVTLTGAWGIYHQVADPMFFDPSFGGHPSLPPTRATHAVIGAQLGGGERFTARVEAYDKEYRDLAQLTRDYEIVSGGTGRARGADVWLKARAPFRVDARLAYGFVRSRRSDPHTGLVASAPFDVTHSLTTMLTRQWGHGWQTSAAYRHATGHPFTPVASATFDDTRQLWVPTYGTPMSERLPPFHRLDLSASWFRRVSPSLQVVAYWSMSNVLDRTNVHAYRYAPDYTARFPVRSIFERSHYFGASVTKT